ncbi:MAG TPA: hypothetical protein VF447_13500, partial [Terriglobales bacterium]
VIALSSGYQRKSWRLNDQHAAVNIEHRTAACEGWNERRGGAALRHTSVLGSLKENGYLCQQVIAVCSEIMLKPETTTIAARNAGGI